MRTRPTFLLALACSMLVPATALGCSIAVQVTRPHIAPADLRFVERGVIERPAWAADASWSSARLDLVDEIRPRFARRELRAAYAQQRSVRLIASRPSDGVYVEDDDPATTCALAGRRVYSATRLIVRETRRLVTVMLASHRTPGSAAGCAISSTSCDDLVFRTATFDRPIGARQLKMLRFHR